MQKAVQFSKQAEEFFPPLDCDYQQVFFTTDENLLSNSRIKKIKMFLKEVLAVGRRKALTVEPKRPMIELERNVRLCSSSYTRTLSRQDISYRGNQYEKEKSSKVYL